MYPRGKKKKTLPKKPRLLGDLVLVLWGWSETFARYYLLPHLPANSLPGCQDQISGERSVYLQRIKTPPTQWSLSSEKRLAMLPVKSTRFCSHGDREHSVSLSLALPVSLMVKSRVFGPWKPGAAPIRVSSRTSEEDQEVPAPWQVLPCARIRPRVLDVVLTASA